MLRFVMDRIAMLTQILDQNPNDTFARYGLAMEHAKSGDVETAIQEFKKLLEANPDYAAGYFMAAQTLAKAGRTDEAKSYLQNGIAAASRTGNAHAKGEMEAMLEDLG
jgi:tetratricopeptide (TPR) repeat protein